MFNDSDAVESSFGKASENSAQNQSACRIWAGTSCIYRGLTPFIRPLTIELVVVVPSATFKPLSSGSSRKHRGGVAQVVRATVS
jgi:hypothetical protein